MLEVILMDKKEKVALLKSLTSKSLKEICKRYELTGFSSLKQKELAKFIADNIDISEDELKTLCETFRQDKLLSKVRDCKDYFLTKQVEIKYTDSELTKGDVGGYSVVINNLGTEKFSYVCDEKCQDYMYQVSKGRYPFCKHYPAVIAELILREDINPKRQKINHIEGAVLDELLSLVNERKKEEGIPLLERGRDIEENLKKLREDFIRISRQDATVARQKYRDIPERVFEHLTNQAFLLLVTKKER
jgi:hypothetical protein